MKKRTHHKSSVGLSYFQHALLSPIIQPDAGLTTSPAAAIKAAQQALQSAGWTAKQAKAETYRTGNK